MDDVVPGKITLWIWLGWLDAATVTPVIEHTLTGSEAWA